MKAALSVSFFINNHKTFHCLALAGLACTRYLSAEYTTSGRKIAIFMLGVLIFSLGILFVCII